MKKAILLKKREPSKSMACNLRRVLAFAHPPRPPKGKANSFEC